MRDRDEFYEDATFRVRAPSPEEAVYALVAERIFEWHGDALGTFSSDPTRADGARFLVMRAGVTRGFMFDAEGGDVKPLGRRHDRWKRVNAPSVIAEYEWNAFHART
jgi:hypothetical protein